MLDVLSTANFTVPKQLSISLFLVKRTGLRKKELGQSVGPATLVVSEV